MLRLERITELDSPGVLLLQPAPRLPRQNATAELQFCVQVHRKRRDQALATWVNHLRTERNRTLDADLARLSPANPVRVGRLDGLELRPVMRERSISQGKKW